jgi:hypothetical protein
MNVTDSGPFCNARAAAAPPGTPPANVYPADVGLSAWFVRRLDPAPTTYLDLHGKPCYLLDDLLDKVGGALP